MRVFASPQEYIQGAGAFETELHRLKRLGHVALLVTDGFVMSMLGEKLQEDLETVGLASAVQLVDEGTQAELLNAAEAVIAENACQFVIALGGGKAMDLGKVIAHANQLPIAVLPTSAATDAATSRISVRYDDAGRFLRYDFYPTNPEVVLVDSEVILKAPAGMLLAGFADGLATYIEARSIWNDGGLSTIGEQPTLAALSLAKTCHETLVRDIRDALAAQKAGVVDKSFDNVVEANIFLSGLGFENGGLSLAHAFHNVVMGDPSIEVKASHGQIVAVGVLLQLLAENATDEYLLHEELFKDLGLPFRLQELSIVLSAEQLQTTAEKIVATKEAGNHIPAQVTVEGLVQALTKLNEGENQL